MENRMKKLFNIEKYTIPQMLLLVAFIIIVFPILLTIPAISNFLNFSDKGQIGDTIGGITAPFINGLAAILVFLAFKEQIKANNLLKAQEQNSLIFNQIQNIQSNKDDILSAISQLQNNIGVSDELIIHPLFNRVNFYLSEFEILRQMLEKNESETTILLLKKSQFLFSILFEDHLNQLRKDFYANSKWELEFDRAISKTCDTIITLSNYFQNK